MRLCFRLYTITCLHSLSHANCHPVHRLPCDCWQYIPQVHKHATKAQCIVKETTHRRFSHSRCTSPCSTTSICERPTRHRHVTFAIGSHLFIHVVCAIFGCCWFCCSDTCRLQVKLTNFQHLFSRSHHTVVATYRNDYVSCLGPPMYVYAYSCMLL